MPILYVLDSLSVKSISYFISFFGRRSSLIKYFLVYDIFCQNNASPYTKSRVLFAQYIFNSVRLILHPFCYFLRI